MRNSWGECVDGIDGECARAGDGVFDGRLLAAGMGGFIIVSCTILACRILWFFIGENLIPSRNRDLVEVKTLTARTVTIYF